MNVLSKAILGTLLFCVSAQVFGADYTGGKPNSSKHDGDNKSTIDNTATAITPSISVNDALILGLEKIIALKSELVATAQLNMNMSQGGQDPAMYNLKSTYKKYEVETSLNNIYKEINNIEKALSDGKLQ